MVQASIPYQTQGNLRRQGYRLETTYGWDTHEVPLYVHAPGKLKDVGEVGFKMRVGNLKSLDRAEAMYLASKGAAGFFMWPPDECFEHDFRDVRYEQRPGGGMVEVRSPEKVMGCKWCRAAKPNGLQGEAEQPLSSAEESTAREAESAPPATESIMCSICGFIPEPFARSGKRLSEKRRLHALKLHTRKHA